VTERVGEMYRARSDGPAASTSQATEAGKAVPAVTMRLCHGVNATLNWRAFVEGPRREQLWRRLRELETRVVRILAFDPRGPDLMGAWETFTPFVEAVLRSGAVPMVTFAQFEPPYDEPRAVRGYATRCAEIVQRCLDRWGGESVREWYWCVWNQPNSEWVSAGMTFELYRRIYEETASQLLSRLGPHLMGRRPRLGGPAVDGFQPFWHDWVWRFVHELDNALVGFVAWHRYGDWREPGAWGAPAEEPIFRSLLLARTAEYQSRALCVSRWVQGRGIQNICGEWNAHSHHEARVSRRFNQTTFGAAYGASTLLHLAWGGADLELFWSATDDGGPFGLMIGAGNPTPGFHVRRLFAHHVRHGDRLSFPLGPDYHDLDLVVAHGSGGRWSALLVHKTDEPARYPVADWIDVPPSCRRLSILGGERGEGTVEAGFEGSVAFRGYGVAVVTNADPPEAHDEPA